MTHPELIDALHAKAASDAQAIWARAHTAAETQRVERSRAVDEARAQAAAAFTAAVEETRRSARADAASRARAIRTHALDVMAQHLRDAAIVAVRRLRDAPDYPALFDALVRELPARPWSRVRVHPDDEALARRSFPDAEIVGDPTVTGGLDVEGAGVRVRNTLEARLAAAWPELLAVVVRDVVDTCACA